MGHSAPFFAPQSDEDSVENVLGTKTRDPGGPADLAVSRLNMDVLALRHTGRVRHSLPSWNRLRQDWLSLGSLVQALGTHSHLVPAYRRVDGWSAVLPRHRLCTLVKRPVHVNTRCFVKKKENLSEPSSERVLFAHLISLVGQAQALRAWEQCTTSLMWFPMLTRLMSSGGSCLGFQPNRAPSVLHETVPLGFRGMILADVTMLNQMHTKGLKL